MRPNVLLTIAIIVLGPASLRAGPLTPPPGPITSTGKTLTEVQPRIAINASNTPGDATCKFKITQPGSYYLSGNILGDTGTHGIKIALGANGGHVRIDMNGFALQGVAGSLSGLVWEGPDLDASKCVWVLDNHGIISGWGEYGIAGRGSGRISNVRVESAGLGCVSLTAGGDRATTIENCTLRTTNGLALLSDGTAKCVIRTSNIEANGCNTTSLCYHGGPVMTGDTNVYVRNSTFSGPIIEVASTGSMTTVGCGRTAIFENVSAPSALHVGAGGAAFVEDRTWDDEFKSCTFSVAIIDIARDGAVLRGLSLRADAATSAPAGVRLAANNVCYGEAQDGSGTDNAYVTASVPIAVEVVGSSNSISGCRISSGATGIRLTGSGNTVSHCALNKTGNDPITNIIISAGSTNNLVIRNEFLNNPGGVTVSNLGGATNGVAPIVTPGNLGAATNPFSNIQH